LLQPLPPHQNTLLEFIDETVGTNVPKQFVPGVERGFRIMAQKGMYAEVLNYVLLLLLCLG
jgi:elongation factor G